MSLSTNSGKAEERRGVGRLGALMAALGVALMVLFAQATPALADASGEQGAEELKAALSNKANVNESTVQLTENAELTSDFWVNKDTTLDLNGHTLTLKSDANAIHVAHTSNDPLLTITNSNPYAEGKIERQGYLASSDGMKGLIDVGVKSTATGRVVIDGVTINALNAPALYLHNGVATLQNGKVMGGGLVQNKQAKAVYVIDGSTLTVNDGVISPAPIGKDRKPHLGGGITALGTGPKVVVNDGTITGANAISTNGSSSSGTYKAQITINGGSLGVTDVATTETHAIYSCAVYLPSAKEQTENVNTITVTGGTIRGGIGILSLGSKVEVSAGEGENSGPVIMADSEFTEEDGVQAGDAKYNTTQTLVKYPPSAIVMAKVTNYSTDGKATLSGGTFQATKGAAIVSVNVDTNEQSASTGLKVTPDQIEVTGGSYSAPVSPSYLKDVTAVVAAKSGRTLTFNYFVDKADARTFAEKVNATEGGSARLVPVTLAEGVTLAMGFAADAEAAKAGIKADAMALGWSAEDAPGADAKANTMWVVYQVEASKATTVKFGQGDKQVYPATGDKQDTSSDKGFGCIYFSFAAGDDAPVAEFQTPQVGTYKVTVTQTEGSKSGTLELALSSATFKPNGGTWAEGNPLAPYGKAEDGTATAFFAADQPISDPGTVALEGKTFEGWDPAPTTAPKDPAALDFTATWKDVPVEPEPGMVVIHRLYNQYEGTHLYTTDLNEVAALVELGWTDEGALWQAPKLDTGDHNIVRLYNPFNGDHYYLNQNDKDQQDLLLNLGWKLDGKESWFGSADPDTGVEVVTLFNPFTEVDTHLYTPDVNEVSELLLLGWQKHDTVIWASALPA